MEPKRIIPPFKIKMVEPINLISKEERIKRLEEAGFNPFALKAKDVFIDLLTDSGTGAMSHFQWGAMMQGDESYAGSSSFYHLESVVKQITGYQFVAPTHQGRGAEQVLIPQLITKKGMSFISNMHFDTTRAHVELAGAEAIDIVCSDCFDTEKYYPFKGNFDLKQLIEVIKTKGADNIAGIIVTITNNSAGGQPVSMENIRAVKRIADQYHIRVFIDAARYAENCYFIKLREAGYENKSIIEIARETFSYADGLMMSSKKDGLVNMGGLIAIKEDKELFKRCKVSLVPREGFPTYGGLSGRDMEALAVGLMETLDERYLEYRIEEIKYLGDRLRDAGIPIQYPTGGHAVYVDCGKICPHIPYDQFPAQAVCNALYIEGGIRAVEIGSMLLGRDPITNKTRKAQVEFMRLTIPRRTYTTSHLDYVADCLIEVYKKRSTLKGLRFVYEPEVLRHFMAELKPIE
jgi:tryptophanase